MDAVPEITLGDKLMLVPILTWAIISAIFQILQRPFSKTPRPSTLLKDFLFAVLRTHLSIINPATEQWLNPSTESNYLQFAKKQGFQPDTDILGSGVKVHWLGGKAAKRIILFFHGGGYCLSAPPGHFAWLFDLQNELSRNHSISVVLVGYTLAPRGQYPEQLKQAAEALNWLLTTHEKSPSDVILAGDSAGGNLTISLLSHLLHPHPKVDTKINLSKPLAGAILISPWVKFATDDDSVSRNRSSDMVTAKAAHRWSSLFLGSGSLDNYNQPILADEKWFRGLDTYIQAILIWGGGGEVLIDSIEAFGKKLKDAHPRTELVVQPGAAHEDFLIEKLLGYTVSLTVEQALVLFGRIARTDKSFDTIFANITALLSRKSLMAPN